MDKESKIKIARFTLDEVDLNQAKFISEHSNLFTIVDDQKLCENCDYLFFDKSSSRLKFHLSDYGELFFDLLSELNYHRKKNYSLKEEPLAKSLGIKSKGQEPKRIIFDVTAGTGKDLTLIYSYGAQVYAFERNVIVYLLLDDAIRLAAMDVKLYFGDPRNLDLSLLPKPDVVYYDPMYPEKKKSALPRKEMQIFKEVIGPDTDSHEFLTFALSIPSDRVVVKRPLSAGPLPGNINASYQGKTTRYDMYKIF